MQTDSPQSPNETVAPPPPLQHATAVIGSWPNRFSLPQLVIGACATLVFGMLASQVADFFNWPGDNDLPGRQLPVTALGDIGLGYSASDHDGTFEVMLEFGSGCGKGDVFASYHEGRVLVDYADRSSGGTCAFEMLYNVYAIDLSELPSGAKAKAIADYCNGGRPPCSINR